MISSARSRCASISESLLGEILDRRRQLVGMLVAEKNRLSTVASEPVRRCVRARVRLEKGLDRTNRDLQGPSR